MRKIDTFVESVVKAGSRLSNGNRTQEGHAVDESRTGSGFPVESHKRLTIREPRGRLTDWWPIGASVD